MSNFDIDASDAEEVSGRIASPKNVGRRRRSTLTPQLAERICERLENGESLRQICQDPIMPAKSTIFLWLRKDKEFAIQYRCAKQVQIDRMLYQFGDQLMEIADDNTSDMRQAKRRIATGKLRVGRLMPKKYYLW